MISKKRILHVSHSYPVILQEEKNGGYVVSCPVLNGCYSQGETVEEALKNIREAITLCLEEIRPPSARFIESNVSLHLVRV